MGQRLLRRGAQLAAAVAAVLAITPALAGAAPSVALHASLVPLRLGGATTVEISFEIAGQSALGSPLSGFDVQLPAGMGFASTSLGLSTCPEAALLAAGASACPRDSVMGYGTVQVQAPFGPQLVSESAPLTAFMTTLTEGHTTMLFYVDALAPVIEPIVLRTQIRAPANSLVSELQTTIPVIPTAPGAGNVVIVGFHSSIGPQGLIYHRLVHGRALAFRPEGLRVPSSCPHGGFVFGADFHFQDGTVARARSVVACPSRRSRRGRA